MARSVGEGPEEADHRVRWRSWAIVSASTVTPSRMIVTRSASFSTSAKMWQQHRSSLGLDLTDGLGERVTSLGTWCAPPRPIRISKFAGLHESAEQGPRLAGAEEAQLGRLASSDASGLVDVAVLGFMKVTTSSGAFAVLQW